MRANSMILRRSFFRDLPIVITKIFKSLSWHDNFIILWIHWQGRLQPCFWWGILSTWGILAKTSSNISLDHTVILLHHQPPPSASSLALVYAWLLETAVGTAYHLMHDKIIAIKCNTTTTKTVSQTLVGFRSIHLVTMIWIKPETTVITFKSTKHVHICTCGRLKRIKHCCNNRCNKSCLDQFDWLVMLHLVLGEALISSNSFCYY